MSLSCEDAFEKQALPFKQLSKFSFNQNDLQGILLIVCFIFSLVLLKKKKSKKTALLLLTCLAATVVKRPICLLYVFSVPTTLTTYTPSFFELSDFNKTECRIVIQLEKNFKQIQQEVLALEGKNFTLTKDSYSGENAFIGSDIKTTASGQVGWEICSIKSGNIVNKASAQQLPTLMHVLEEYPQDIVSCVVSKLPSHTQIPPHVGYSKLIKRLMLPVKVPKKKEDCFLCVNREKKVWTEGRCILWDDCFQHAVMNNTDETRIVLYFDVRRPRLGRLLNKVIDLAANSPIVKEEISRTEKKVFFKKVKK